MRYLHVAVIVLFVAAIVIFSVQNLQTVEVSFFRLNARLPLALVIAGVYVLGAVTGGSLLSLLRRSFKGAKPST